MKMYLVLASMLSMLALSQLGCDSADVDCDVPAISAKQAAQDLAAAAESADKESEAAIEAATVATDRLAVAQVESRKAAKAAQQAAAAAERFVAAAAAAKEAGIEETTSVVVPTTTSEPTASPSPPKLTKVQNTVTPVRPAVMPEMRPAVRPALKYVVLFTTWADRADSAKATEIAPEMIVTDKGATRKIPEQFQSLWVQDGKPVAEASNIPLPALWDKWDNVGTMPEMAPDTGGSRISVKKVGSISMTQQGYFYFDAEE